MNIDHLLNKIEILIATLKKDGKTQSAKFFLEQYEKIKTQKEDLHKDALERLSTCRAMAQYANFSINEENILGDIILYANELLMKK